MRTKDGAKNVFTHRSYFPVTGIGITNANDEVRFLIRGPFYKES